MLFFEIITLAQHNPVVAYILVLVFWLGILGLGGRRLLAVAAAMDEALTWPGVFTYQSSTVWPRDGGGLLLPIAAWAAVAWLATERPLPDAWLPARGIHARKLLAAVAVGTLCAGNPAVFLLPQGVSSSGTDSAIAWLTFALWLAAHVPLWHVLVYGWRGQPRGQHRRSDPNATVPAPPAGMAHRR